MTVNQVLKDSRRRMATTAVSSCSCNHQEAIDNLFDILIEAGVLELSLHGKHTIRTSNYHGRFDVVEFDLGGPSGTPPGTLGGRGN